jgi:hypothetical protein
VRLTENAAPVTTAEEVVALWPESRWQSLTVAQDEKGLIAYDWASQRVVESRDGLPGPAAWLVARRSLSDPTDIAYYLSNAPADSTPLKLAQVASTRYRGEHCIEEPKSETDLDEYEVRYWHSWYRHITFSIQPVAERRRRGGPQARLPSAVETAGHGLPGPVALRQIA